MNKKELEVEEEVAPVAEEAVEVAAEEVVVEEPKEEEPKVDEVAEEKALIDKIAQKILGYGEAKKAAEKKQQLGGVFYKDEDIEVYKSQKTGKSVTMKKSAMSLSRDWFVSFLKYAKDGNPDNFYKMKEIREKLEPLWTGTAAEGGNIVPTMLYNTIIPIIDDISVIRPNAFVIDMTGMKTNQLNLPGISGKPYVSWNAEKAQKGTTSVEFNTISLTPYILAAIVPITTQLIDDSPFNVVQLVSMLLAEAIAREEDRVFMVGTGTTQPTGIDTYTFATVSAGGALSWRHLNTAYWRLGQGYRQKAFWIMHANTMATVGSMVDSQLRPIFEQAIYEDGLPRIKNRPVLENNNFGDNKIFFIDLSAYWIGQKRNMSIDIAKEATIRDQNLWERNMIAVRVEEKLDAELTTTRAGVEISNVRT